MKVVPNAPLIFAKNTRTTNAPPKWHQQPVWELPCERVLEVGLPAGRKVWVYGQRGARSCQVFSSSQALKRLNGQQYECPIRDRLHVTPEACEKLRNRECTGIRILSAGEGSCNSRRVQKGPSMKEHEVKFSTSFRRSAFGPNS
jgi:hypothetical protein